MVRLSQPQTTMNLIEHRSLLTIGPETQLGARSLCLIKAETLEDTAFVAPSCDRFLNALVALSVPSPRPVGCDASPQRASISSKSGRGFPSSGACFQRPGEGSGNATGPRLLRSGVEAERPASLPANNLS
jgi:hypothetical protein